MARIVSFLDRRRQIAEGVIRQFNELQPKNIQALDIGSIAHILRAPDKEVADVLIELMLHAEKPYDTVAYLALRNSSHPRVNRWAERVTASPESEARIIRRARAIQNNVAIRRWISQLPGREPFFLKPAGFNLPPSLHPKTAAQFLAFLRSRPFAPWEMEKIWLKSCDALDPKVRIEILAQLHSESHPGLIALAAIESLYGDPGVIMKLARMLTSRPEREAEEILVEWSLHPTLMIRAEADHALSKRSPAAPVEDWPRIARAGLEESPTSGLCRAHLVTQNTQDLFYVWIVDMDTWDNGLYGIQLEEGLEEREVEGFLEYLLPAEKGAWTPLRPAEAKGWLFAAIDLAANRNYKVPAAWALLNRQLRGGETPAPPADVIFGRSCRLCGKEIHRRLGFPMKSLVVGPVAICSACLRQVKTCQRCGKKSSPLSMHVVTHRDSGRVDFYCESCHCKPSPQGAPDSAP